MWLQQHRLAGVTYELLPNHHPLRQSLRPMRLQCFIDYQQALPTLEALLAASQQRGFRWIGFKGWGIAHLRGCYSNPELRPLGDLDLMVRRKDIPAAIEAAAECGFIPQWDNPAVKDFYLNAGYNIPCHRQDGGLFEIHHALYRDIGDNYFADILKRCERTTRNGIPIDFMDPVDLMLVLSTHLSANGEGPAKWIWLYDLLLLARGFSQEDWDLCLEYATRAKLSLFVFTSLKMIQRLWGHESLVCPDSLLEALQRELTPPERWMARRFLHNLPDPTLRRKPLALVRRLPNRPTRSNQWVRSILLPHPGATLIETGASSPPRFFLLARLQNGLRRITKSVPFMMR